MVRQWQEMFYDERYSEVYLSPDLPDYVKWAEAMGCVGIRVESPEEVARPSRRPTASTTARSSSTSAPTPSRRSSRWSPPAPPTTTSSSTRRSRPGRRPMSVYGRRPAPPHLSVLVENKAGVLARVAGLFSRRGYNISPWPWPRPTTSASAGSPSWSTSSRRRWSRSSTSWTSSSTWSRSSSWPRPDATERELLLATVAADPTRRGQVIQLVGVFGGKIVDVGHDRLTVMLAGAPSKIDDFENLIRRLRHRRAPADRPRGPA